MTRASDTARLLGAGGTLNGALSVDTISEKTSGSGVTIDSLNIKDSGIGGGQIGGRRNIAYNGAMNVAQRSTSVTGIGGSQGYFTCDRWSIYPGGTAGRLTMTQTADGPAGISANCIKLDCTTADTSIAASEFLVLEQRFEGKDLQGIGKGVTGAKEITVSFYVKANAAFTFGVELYDIDNTRQVTKLYNTTTDWVRHELTFPADVDDGSSPFDDNTAHSLSMYFWLHGGSTYTGGTLNTAAWANSTDANRVAGIDSFFSSTDNNFFITGVQMEIGSVATPFEHRSFGEELGLCSRYYQNSFNVGNVPGTSTAGNDSIITTSWTDGNAPFPPFNPMRSAPTITIRPRGSTSSGSVSHGGSTKGVTPTDISNKGLAYLTVASSPTGGQYNAFSYELDAEL